MVMTDVLSERSLHFMSKNALISFFGKSKILAVVRNANEMLEDYWVFSLDFQLLGSAVGSSINASENSLCVGLCQIHMYIFSHKHFLLN